MKLVGMMPVRNESWVLGLSLRVALLWCDEVVVLLHACTDRSEEIAVEVSREHPHRVWIFAQAKDSWKEMQHRQAMLELGRSREIAGTHFAIIDADEVLTGNLLSDSPSGHCCVKGMLETMPAGSIMELPGYNLRNPHAVNPDMYVSAGHWYHSNGVWGNRWFSTAFADAPNLGWSGDCFHHREPGPRKLTSYRPIQQGQGGVMHLWGASERRLLAKHALYKVTERLRWPQKPRWIIDREYSLSVKGDPAIQSYGTPQTWTYAPVPESWWTPYAHLMKYLDVDAERWQEAEVRRLVAEHGREKFAGLDLFGVA